MAAQHGSAGSDVTLGAGGLAPGFVAAPYWQDGAPPPPAPPPTLPAATDVLIVGAGYTGLSAARETALAGRSTLVLDAGPAGGGCSSRNGGQVAFSVKPTLAALAARHGSDVARRLYAEGFEAIAALRARARAGLDCDWRDSGGFCGAPTRRHYDALRRELDAPPAGFEQRVTLVPPERIGEEIDSPLYHGGAVYHDDAAIDPARLTGALLAEAGAAGAVVHGGVAVTALARVAGGFEVATARGAVRARQVLLATNGYTGPLSPWHRRRVFPIGSYLIATEALEPALVRRLIPRQRNVGDMRHVVIYVRPSPDGRRILFGGRASAGERDVVRCVPRLRAMLAELFPALAATRISHAWMGFVGFTFDTLPHLGERGGLWHCLGYCGQGIPSATYYGRKAGLAMAGRPDGACALAGLEFPARPYYTGRPWFLPAAIAGYRLRDALGL